MAKINIVDEVLNHTDEEIIEYLYTIASDVYRAFRENENSKYLLTCYGDVEDIYNILHALKNRNTRRNFPE